MARYVPQLGQMGQTSLPEGMHVSVLHVLGLVNLDLLPELMSLLCVLCVKGETALQEGDSIVSQSQSLAAAVQQPGAPRCQPWKI